MDRRSLIARGLATVFAVGVAPASLAAPISGFDRALMEYRKARAYFEHIAGELDIQASIAAGKASDVAFERMLAADSRTTADLATKLETMLVEYEDSEWDADRVRLIAIDALRLSGGAHG